MKKGISRFVIATVSSASFILFAGFPAIGGTIISNNLPANTVIINIDGTQDGAAVSGGVNYSLWYQPFNSGGNLLQYTIQPGTYRFRIVNPADAALLFPALTSLQTNEIYTGWTYNAPWIESYIIFDSAATNNNSMSQMISGADSAATYSDAASAYRAAITNGFYDVIRTGPDGRGGPVSYGYIFTNTETLIFAVPDYGLYDNAGGVSVLISPLVLPATPPRLNVAASVGGTMARWPTNDWEFVLAETTNLASGVWTDVTNVPTVLGTNYLVAFPEDSANRFFRLHFP